MEISWNIICFAQSSKSRHRPEGLKAPHLRGDRFIRRRAIRSGSPVFSLSLAELSCLILNNLYTFRAVQDQTTVPKHDTRIVTDLSFCQRSIG